MPATTPRSRSRRPRVPREWRGDLPAHIDLLPEGELMREVYADTPERFAARHPWTRASLVMSETPGYLDRLCGEVYRVQINPPRPVSDAMVARIRDAWDDDLALVDAILLCPSMPVRHPFLSAARFQGKFAANPVVAGQVAQMIRNLGFERTILAVQAPVDPTKQQGPQYQQWVARNWEVCSDFDELCLSAHPVTFLGVSDKGIKEIGARHFGHQGRKGFDSVVRISTGRRERFIGMEAKFVSADGGGQKLQVDDALRLKLRSDVHDVSAAAVIDGVPLFADFSGAAKESIRKSKLPVVSSLLLGAFLTSHLDELDAA